MRYFAYGSNMSFTRISARVPSASVICTCTLYQHELRFHKHGQDNSAKCDTYFTGRHTDYVLGVLYEMDPLHKARLDRIEGLGKGYNLKQVELIAKNNQRLSAITYFATYFSTSLKPYDWYMYHVISGAIESALDKEYIQRIERIETIKDNNKERSLDEYALHENHSIKG